jgi:DNA ligase-1
MSTVKFRPMLAASCDDLDQLRYPLLATPKIDGIRCIIIDGVATSRSLKPIPNAYIQSVIGKPEFNGLDGELLVGASFQQATSGIMSEDGEPDFTFYVFDTVRVDWPYWERVSAIGAAETGYGKCRIEVLRPVKIDNRAALDQYTEEQLALGHEGVMVRTPNSPYKQGRATFKEGFLTKIKPFEDAEATVVGFEERMHNGNEATTNALGRTERSSHQANLVPMGTLGALVCSNQAKWPGVTFNIGTGFDDLTRANIWHSRADVAGRTVRFKYQAIGTVDKPRIPVFEGFRSAEDMS